MEFKKANSPQQKQQRQAAILDAAEQLLVKGDYNLPSAIEVARQAGLAKGSLYNYFNTKESIFLALLGRYMQLWVEDVEKQLRMYDKISATDISDYLIRYWQTNNRFSHLMRLADTQLFPNVETRTAVNHQTRVNNDLKRLAQAFRDVNRAVETTAWLAELKTSLNLITLAWTICHPSYQTVAEHTNFEQLSKEFLAHRWQALIDTEDKLSTDQSKGKSGWRKFF